MMASLLPSSKVSVISSSRRCAARPVSLSAAATMALTLAGFELRGRQIDGNRQVFRPGHAAARQASRSTHAPILSINAHVLRDGNERQSAGSGCRPLRAGVPGPRSR